MHEYPQTLAAVEGAELSLWPVVDALVAELETTGSKVKAGEYDRAAQYLEANGFRSWSARRLRDFHNLGTWADARAGRADAAFKAYPVERVIEARKAARGDHARALELLAQVKSKRELRPDRATPAQVIAGLSDPNTRGAVLSSSAGLAAVQRASIEAHAQQAKPEREHLPTVPSFARVFWAAVVAVESAHEVMQRHGVEAVPLEPEAQEAALRMRRKADEISAAISEAAVEARLEEGV
jgi:hypothetical protein